MTNREDNMTETDWSKVPNGAKVRVKPGVAALSVLTNTVGDWIGLHTRVAGMGVIWWDNPRRGEGNFVAVYLKGLELAPDTIDVTVTLTVEEVEGAIRDLLPAFSSSVRAKIAVAFEQALAERKNW